MEGYNNTVEIPVTGDENSEKKRLPERRLRRYQPHWKDTYTWLYYDDNVEKMFCRVCKKHPEAADPSSAYFAEGCCNFQIMSLQSHAKSKSHMNAEEIDRRQSRAEQENVWTLNPHTADASSPSSSRGPPVMLHQFARPMQLFPNTTTSSGTTYKTATDLIQGLRAMSERLLRNPEYVDVPAPDGSGFPNLSSQGSFATSTNAGLKKDIFTQPSQMIVKDSIDNSRQSPTTSQSDALQIDSLNRLKYMFLNAHAVAKFGMSVTSYKSLCELDTAKGLDMYGDHDAKQCQALQKVIAQTETEKIRQTIEKCNYFSLVCDSYNIDQHNVVVFYVKTVVRGKQQTSVLNVIQKDPKDDNFFTLLDKGMDQELDGVNWKAKLVGVLHDLDLNWYTRDERCKSTCSEDDETTRQVKIKTEPGVEQTESCYAVQSTSQTSSRHESLNLLPNILTHRCLIHRILNFVAETIKPLPYDKRVGELLRVVQQFCGDIFPERPDGDRLLSNMDATWLENRLSDINIFRKNYSHIVNVLNQHNDDLRLKSLCEFCKSKRCVMYIHFLVDLLGVVEHSLMRPLQSGTGSIGEVYECVSDTLDNFKKLVRRSGQQLVKVERESVFQGHKLLLDDEDSFDTDRTFIISSVIADLAPRLCDLHEDKMTAMAKLTSLSQWPDDSDQLKDYADEDVLLIVETYNKTLESSGVDTDKCLMEWSQLKNHIRRRFASFSNITWENVFSTCRGKCENILSVLTFILSLPGHSRDIQSGYAYLTNIQSNRPLNTEDIKNQLRIYLGCPEIGQFDPEPHLETWSESSQDGGPPRKRPRIISPDEREVGSTDHQQETYQLKEAQ